MATNPAPAMTTSNDRLDRIEASLERISDKVEKNAESIDKLTNDISRTRQDLDLSLKWQDRVWDVVKWVGGISAALSISAAIALVGIVIRLALIAQ